MPCTETIRTPVTEMLGITKPIMLAGMNVAAGPELAAAVTNAGGIGVVRPATRAATTPRLLGHARATATAWPSCVR